ncbi:MAG: sugar ABC transporter ATP-binding protein [Phycisphaerae bacterium]|nr:sugar ABC transporter ATP-binding protein [Phycisphaerae bacterium]
MADDIVADGAVAGHGTQPLVRLVDISKAFGSVQVLRHIHFSIYPGEVHVLAGENGAGKSTLVKILAGVYSDYAGAMEIGGKPVRLKSPVAAVSRGISVIHQELSLVPSMTVADNIFLGRFDHRGGFVRDQIQRRQTAELLARLGVQAKPQDLVGELPIATRHLIEIVKAMSRNSRVIVMDEPTSALNRPEAQKLFSLIRYLKARGCGIVYISHKMDEIEQLADRITVLRDGEFIGSVTAAELPIPKLIQWMVGRPVEQQFPRHAQKVGDERLRLDGFTVADPRGGGHKPLVDHIDMSVRQGEILGLAGLEGSGNSHLLLGLFGACGKRATGRVSIDGRSVIIQRPRQAIGHGLALLTNDRKATGLIPSLSIIANITLAHLKEFSTAGWRRPARERKAAADSAQALHLRAASLSMDVGKLSGGNQQKVVMAKWMHTHPRVLLLDEPTRGVDIGAKREIYDLMNRWTAAGISIILITSEMPELLAMSDRILVMHRGRITGEFARGNATPEAILQAAMGRTSKQETTP